MVMNDDFSRTYIPTDYARSEAHEASAPRARRTWQRLLLFASTFIISAAVSLTYTFIRPAVYASNANLLIESQDPNKRDQETSDHDLALQREVLMSRELLTKVLETLPKSVNASESEPLTLDSLKSMLTVLNEKNSAVIKLGAEGPQKAILPEIVNTWVDRYVDLNSQMQESYSNTISTSLKQQLDSLQKTITAKREDLKAFGDKYDIVSMERDENRVLSKLKGLNNSLNKASEARVLAESNLRAVKDAIAKGKWSGKYQKTPDIYRLEQEAEPLQETVKGYEERYTPKYIQMDKDAKATIDKLHRLQKRIALKYKELQTAAIENAEERIQSARQSESDLKEQIAAYEKKASLFSARFSEQQSLKEDLDGLEKLNRDYQGKLVALQIKNNKDMLQVEVLERAAVADVPVRPNYVRDACISVAGSFFLALFTLLIFDFLMKPSRPPLEETATTIMYNQIYQNPPLPQPRTRARLNAPAAGPTLPPPAASGPPRELSDSEIKILFESADALTRRLIACLLSGLGLKETAHLKWGNIDFEAGELQTPGRSFRRMKLTRFLQSVLEKDLPTDVAPDAYVLHNSQSGIIPPAALEKYIYSAARHAQIVEPHEITARALRHTYNSFLARQGVPFHEMEKRVGRIPDNYYTVYRIMAPPGAGISLNEAKLALPMLEKLLPASE
jgi:polysaccharide biosynthesis transport protein